MANDYFRFRQFTIHQGQCAMKVGTDGTLLGAWATGGRSILDVGTGTGLIALMMAQRFSDARVVGIDIDREATEQARQNVADSPFADRIAIEQIDMKDYEPQQPFDAIVCNPPFFSDALLGPDTRRNTARHATSFSYQILADRAWQWLTDSGVLSVVVPFDYKSQMETAMLLQGFSCVRLCEVKTKASKPPRRHLLSFAKHPQRLERETIVVGDDRYVRLTKDFYLYESKND